MTEKLDCAVIGAGLVGLATGRALVLAGREVVVLESEARIGCHASSRNSEVVHAGLYYPEASLKARLCVRGREMLYAYCDTHHVPYQRIGKLVTAASESDLTRLKAINDQAVANGVEDIAFLNADEVRRIEPAVLCAGALLSPSTGIVDTHSLMLSLQGDIERHGGNVILNSRVHDIRTSDGVIRFECSGEQFSCNTLINSAGLWAQELLAGVEERASSPPARYLAKGHYFAYPGRSPFSHLVYPLPADGGLGIHATNDLSGGVRFGPDMQWVDSVDYAFDAHRKPAFVAAIKTYFPGLNESKLVPAYTGIRSKLAGPDERFEDFVIQGEDAHGVTGLVNLFGIDSPGLTAALAIAEFVNRMQP